MGGGSVTSHAVPHGACLCCRLFVTQLGNTTSILYLVVWVVALVRGDGVDARDNVRDAEGAGVFW